ncbi:MAG: hypothetical protein HEP71_02895 [Roseivirga sp.]|nr:hypothetical protein [Roseivirga sp.]
MRIKYLFLLLLCIWTSSLVAQTGPGGVGSSSTNVVWLKADEITGLTNGDDILTWTDASGNSNTLTAPSSTFSPVYQTGVINGLPVVRFNKTNGRIRRTSFTGFPTTSITAIYVNSTTDSGDGSISYASSASNNDFLLFRSENLNVYRGTNTASGVTFNDGNFHITNAVWQSSDGSVEVWKDGSRDFNNTGFRTGTSITAGGSLAIAGEQDSQDGGYDAAQAHFGDFSEVIIFNTFLNQAQNIIVSNYLAAKYGLTISNDRFAYDATHPNDVAGIGREAVSNEHTAATSADILRIQNASGLNANQEYLLFGHDDGDATTAWTTTEAPDAGTDIQRLAREWRLDETGDIGTVDFVVETAAMPSLPVNHTIYALMVDADGDFSSGASVYEMTLSAGTEYTVTGVDFNDGDYVAIAAVRPTIQHTLTSSAGAESVNASIEVGLNFITASSRTVDVTTADITTTVVDDYTALSGSTVTITAGNSTTTYAITIDDDSDSESNESLTATLDNPSAGINLGTNTVHTYSIEDNDNTRKVYFDAETSSGSEATTSVNVGVSLSVVDLLNPSSVDYSVTGGTAIGSGTDYTLASGTVNFAAGVTTGSFNISIINESLYEGGETIIITLSNPVNCNLDNTMPFEGTGFITHTYTITNDDTAPTIQFNSSSSSGSETVTAVAFQVDLSVASGLDASASFAVTGTATGSGTDYTLADGTVTVSAGSTTANINAVIVNDVVEELSETMILTLSAPTDASLGTNTVHTYTIINNAVFGFTGPGGVGGSTTNMLWVRPEELASVADGTDITTWSDFSGNSHDLTQSDNSFTPRYYGSVLNSQPIVRFEQANGRLIHNSFSDFPTSAISAIYVNRTSDSGDGVLSYASSASDNDFLLFSSNNLQFYRSSSTSTSVSFNDNSFHIANVTWQGSDGALAVWKDGTQSFTGTAGSGTSFTQGGNLALGGEQDGVNSGYTTGQAHAGDFAEVIIYNQSLNTTTGIIVQNYLSAKYNIALTANDVYDQDDNGDFDFEVAGIGRINSSDLHLDAKGSGIVRINDPQDLDDEEFLMWGHDNAALAATNTDVPAGVSRRFERVWRVSEVNRSAVAVNVGGVDITFDLTGLGTVVASDLVLLIDADGTFATGATQVTGAIDDGSNTYRFNNVTGLTDNMRFTLGSADIVATPLPIELISFTADITQNGQVKLQWETASELNNNHFTLERSSDGNTVQEIATLPGAGNSFELLRYEYTDTQPLSGRSFYRLRQTDFNGESDVSEFVSIYIEPQKADYQYKIYPNPVRGGNSLWISFDALQEQPVMIEVFEMGGRLRYRESPKALRKETRVEVPTTALGAGLHLLRVTRADGSVKVFKLIIQ